MLIECNAEYELCPTLKNKEETRSQAYLAINPNGQVPAIVTDRGHVITEVAATLYYLAHIYPAADLWPNGDLEAETDIISWMSFTASTVHGSPAKGSEYIANAFSVANLKLAGRQWAIGHFSVADIHLFRVYWRFRSAIATAPRTYSALEAHCDRMLARPAVQKAIEIEKQYE